MKSIFLMASLIFFATITHAENIKSVGAPQLLANYYAKEFCTCIFVIGQTFENCQDDTKHISFLMRVDVDAQEREIRTSSLLSQARAKYQDTRFGCILVAHQKD